MTELAPIRLGLEPGYDGGRVGAWLLDLPGAFGWARSREAAQSQSSATAGWWRDWLGRHGEAWPLAGVGWPEVAEEVAVVVDGDYERNATFAADRVPVGKETLVTALRRLEFARADLLALVDRLRIVEAADGERSADEILRHIAGVEIWLGSRVDPAARYPGPTDPPNAVEHLAATREWAAENLRRLHDSGPAAARTDSKGETWTLAKVVRRYVYHSIDHLRELDRRLAIAERRTERLRWTRDRLADERPLARVLRSVGWDRRTVDPSRLERAIERSYAMVGAWDGDELVGFTRELGDGTFTSHISMVVVDPRWHGLGIASRLLHMLMDGRPEVRFTLNAAAGMAGFYRQFGFEPDPSAMGRRRQE
jgi:ribosomal protein S18 acetylase RimI-like enzyme